MESTPNHPDLGKLLALIDRLRAPDGCPWDRQQRPADLRAYLIEEAHEVAAAIDTSSWDEVAEELGDLLFQVAFLAALAQEEGRFTLAEVIDRIHDKMVARHPHVFGDEHLDDVDAVRRAWEERKQREQRGSRSILAGVATTLPALVGAYRLTQKAAGVGFDWTSPAAVLEKVDEEIDELRRSLASETGSEAQSLHGSDETEEELGDLLFTVANLARHLHIDPERALARANLKFRRRFGHIEDRIGQPGGKAGTVTRESEAQRQRLETLWQEAKALERAATKSSSGDGTSND